VPPDDAPGRPPFGAWLAGASALLSSKRYGDAGRIKVVSHNRRGWLASAARG
jgi:hypothetical protein